MLTSWESVRPHVTVFGPPFGPHFATSQLLHFPGSKLRSKAVICFQPQSQILFLLDMVCKIPSKSEVIGCQGIFSYIYYVGFLK